MAVVYFTLIAVLNTKSCRTQYLLFRCLLQKCDTAVKIKHLRYLESVGNIRSLYGVRINHAPASVWTRTGYTGRTGRILYTWPYYTPSKGPSNCPKS